MAQAYASASPIMASALQVVSGEADPAAAKAVIGAGTALGQAALLPDGQGSYLPAPSEGGHASFPFESEKEFAYLNFHLKEVGGPYVTCNTVVSGLGLSLVHQFLTGEKLTPAELEACALPDSETVQWMARCARLPQTPSGPAPWGVYCRRRGAAAVCLDHEEFWNSGARRPWSGTGKIPVFLTPTKADFGHEGPATSP
jgi:hypothetical protein